MTRWSAIRDRVLGRSLIAGVGSLVDLSGRGTTRASAPPPEPEFTWHIQYQRGGRTYTYQRTRTQLAELLAERAAHGRQPPHLVQAIVNGQPIDVQVDIE